MDGAGGTALEWALALFRTPTEHHRLRQRPLPDGVTELLMIAVGAGSDESARAATRLRERPEILCEAARFYAREILFHAQADAYRTLGVALDAPAEQIRQHFRLLQAWLHPDRQDSGDDSVFAARVNAAWNQLRNGDRRAAYDARLAAAAELGSPIEHPAAAAQPAVALWNPPERSTPQARRRHRILVAALLGVCAALGWQVIQQSDREPDPWPGDGTRPVEESAERPFAPDAIAVQAAARVAAPTREPQVELQPDAGVIPAIPETVLAPEPVRSAASEVPRLLPQPVAMAPVVDSVVRPVPSRPAPSHPIPPASVTKPVPVDPPAAPVVAPSAVAAPSVAAPATEPPPALGHGTLFGRLHQAFARGGQRSTTPGLAVDGEVNYSHIRKARRVGDQFLDFIASSSGTPPPIWSSAAALDRADNLRRALLRAGVPRMGEPQWRIGRDSAALTSRYSVGGEQRGAVSAELVWREDRWLVSSVVVEVAP